MLGKETELSILGWYTSFPKTNIPTICRWPTHEQSPAKLMKGVEGIMKQRNQKNVKNGETELDAK